VASRAWACFLVRLCGVEGFWLISGSLFGSQKAPGEVEQVAERLGTNAREADEDQGMVLVVRGEVVDIRMGGEEVSADFETGADDEGFGFGGAVGGDAGEELSAHFEGGGAVSG